MSHIQNINTHVVTFCLIMHDDNDDRGFYPSDLCSGEARALELLTLLVVRLKPLHQLPILQEHHTRNSIRLLQAGMYHTVKLTKKRDSG